MKKLLTIFFASVFWGTYAQNANHNYIEERIYTDEAATEAKALTAIVYYDGLGRPVQEVQKGASPVDGQDIIKHIEYEPNIGQLKDYLPYAGSGANFATDAKQQTLGFYNTAKYQNTTNPYSEYRLEASPRQRILETAAPGADWAMDASEKHTIRNSYSLNISSDAVRRYTVTTTWNASRGAFVSSIAANGNYPIKTLYKTIVKNENWKVVDGKNNTIEEFKDLKGNVILKRNYNNSVAHDTYYVYDNYGNLSYVLPPLANGAITSTTLDKLCYQYRYDEKNRLVEKKLPGKEWEYIVYDKADRVVMTGPVYSPFGSGSKGWLFTKYDVFGRQVYSGFYSGHSVTANNRKAIKDLVYAQTNSNETKTTANQTVDGVAIRYTNTKFPTGSVNLLTVNYYDDYNFPNAPTSFPSIEGQPTLQAVKGLSTGSWTRVVTTAAERKATLDYMLYNAKYQPLRTYTKNHIGGYTQTDSELTFTGLPTKTTTKHWRDGSVVKGGVITVVDNYTYDEQERLIKHTQKTDNRPEQLIAENVYDALGALVTKNVGGLETATDPLQTVDYKYNVRGWLTDINNLYSVRNGSISYSGHGLFNMKINYNEVFDGDNETEALYNGNISSSAWRTKTDDIVRGYGYNYDDLHRLNYATHLGFQYYMNLDRVLVIRHPRTGQYAEDLTYDKNGNILTLDRFGQEELGQPIQIDELTYTYDGNRLLKVADGTNNPDGFKDGDNTGNDYTYDTMGNLKTDQNKGITNVKYNHLNLPTEVIFTTGKIGYTYDASGTRVGKKIETATGITTTTDYLDGFQYENFRLKFFHHPEGFVEYKMVNSGDLSYYTYIYHFIYKDHLGNNRLTYADLDEDGVVNPTEIIEENNYYPFGLRHKGYNELATENPAGFKYKFGGKELNDELGFEVYDFGARNYDPALGRWMNIDPLAEEMRRFSPYNYAFNNPIFFIDPDGMMPMGFDKNKLDDLEDLDGWIENLTTGEITYNASFTEENTPEGYEYFDSGANEVKGEVYHSDGRISKIESNSPNTVNLLEVSPEMGPTVLGGYPGQGLEELISGGLGWLAEQVVGSDVSTETAIGIDLAMAAVTKGKSLKSAKSLVGKTVKNAIPKGFKETKEFGKSHGQKVYKKGERYISKDAGQKDGSSHNGGVWKEFKKVGNKLVRTGTLDENLKRIKD